MSPDPRQSLFAQFTGFAEGNVSYEDWVQITHEFGVYETASRTNRFLQSWRWGDEDRTTTTLRFLRTLDDRQEELTTNLMRRLYEMAGGSDAADFDRYPALRALEDGEELASGVPHVPIHVERFLDLDEVPGNFYPDLVGDVNQCYRLGIYDATLVLTRKLIENQLIDIFHAKYGTEEIDLYYRPEQKRSENFGTLVENFEKRLDDFNHHPSSTGKELIEDVNHFRTQANVGAHSIETDISEDEIDEYQQVGEHVVKILFRLYESVR